MGKTYKEQFEEALACKTPEEAQVWLEKEARECMNLNPKGYSDIEYAKKIVLGNIGYMAGYYDKKTSEKIYHLFNAKHLIFGKPDYWDRVTPEKAFKAGIKRAKQQKAWCSDKKESVKDG